MTRAPAVLGKGAKPSVQADSPKGPTGQKKSLSELSDDGLPKFGDGGNNRLRGGMDPPRVDDDLAPGGGSRPRNTPDPKNRVDSSQIESNNGPKSTGPVENAREKVIHVTEDGVALPLGREV